MKNKLMIVFGIFLLLAQSILALEIGPDYKKDCRNDGCVIEIYPEIRYYQENGQWTQVDENLGAVNCETGYEYCVDKNLYQFNIKHRYEAPTIEYKTTKLSFNLINIAGFAQLSSEAEIKQNSVTYKNIYQGIDLKYTYLPTMLKEEIIITDKNIFALINNDIVIDFNLNSYGTPIINDEGIIKIGNLSIKDLIAYDPTEAIEIPFTLTNNNLRLTIPIDWLKNESRSYPVIIDPTITLDSSSINADLHVSYNTGVNPNTYLRQDSSTSVSVGILNTDPPAFSRQRIRGVIEFNTSSISKYEHITDMNLNLFFHQIGDNDNNIIKVFNMEKNSDNYTNDETPCFGNCNFWLDMGNGTLYNTTNVTLGFNYLNLTLASSDMENSLLNNITWFGFGFSASESNPSLVPQSVSKFRPGTWSNISERPVLTINTKTNNPPIIQINNPQNNSIFGDIGNIILNATITDLDNDLITAEIFGSNNSNLTLEDLIFKQENVSSGSIISYNWTSPVLKPDSSTVLLMHLDNRKEFNENSTFAYDFSNNSNNGLVGDNNLTLMPIFVQNAGKFAGSYQFDGIDDLIFVNDSQSLDITKNITLEAWVKPEMTTVVEDIFTKNDAYRLGVINDGRIFFFLHNGSGYTQMAKGNIMPRVYSHIAATYDGSFMKIYLNGNLTGKKAAVINISANDANLIIGSLNRWGSESFNGTMDELVIYNRALLQEEIIDHFKLKAGTYYWNLKVNDRRNTSESGSLQFDLRANESEGDIAIEQGILNSIPNAGIHNEQQIYTWNLTNNERLGRFDKFTINGTKRWSFNYITEGEIFTNMLNISSTFFTLEIFNLTKSQIKNQIEQFIKDTINS